RRHTRSYGDWSSDVCSSDLIQPPTLGPNVGASVETMPRIAGIIARRGPSNMAKPVANTVGTIAPPTKPWIARKAIIELMSQARRSEERRVGKEWRTRREPSH